LRPEPIRRLLREQLAGRRDHGNRLWLLVNAELWYRMMILGRSAADLREELSEIGREPQAGPAGALLAAQ
ncbi:MAG: hypothetical protein ACREU3_13130, partial [Steroidobacteraceae bacterium]